MVSTLVKTKTEISADDIVLAVQKGNFDFFKFLTKSAGKDFVKKYKESIIDAAINNNQWKMIDYICETNEYGFDAGVVSYVNEKLKDEKINSVIKSINASLIVKERMIGRLKNITLNLIL